MAEAPDFHINFFSVAQGLDRFRNFHSVEFRAIKIVDRAALLAYEVVVGLCVRVKPDPFT